jgi:hypothetical protein
MANEIERAVHDVQDALNLPAGKDEHLATVVANLIGTTSETDEARIAALEEADRAIEAEACARAEIEHLMAYITKHKGNPPPFEYKKPEGRRARGRTALSPMDILQSLAETFRLPDPTPRLIEATPTGSITSLPRRERREAILADAETPFIEREHGEPDCSLDAERAVVAQTQHIPNFDDPISPTEHQPTAQERVDADREQYPSVLAIDESEVGEDFQPKAHRTGFIPVTKTSEYSPHETRGYDLPTLVPEVVDPIDLGTNKITITTTAENIPKPVKAMSVTDTQESSIMTETLPERHRRWWRRKKKSNA